MTRAASWRSLLTISMVFACLTCAPFACHAQQPYDLVAKVEPAVLCYGDAYSGSKHGNFCFGFFGFLGQPLLAAGSEWGDLSILNYMGTAEYRGFEADCEAAYNETTLQGKLWISDGIINNYRYSRGINAESSTYCIFKGQAATVLIQAIWKNEVVHVRTLGPNGHRGGFSPEGALSRDKLASFFQLVRANTTATVPFDDYRGGMGGLYKGILRWMDDTIREFSLY
ncbi:MAG TPA: hypothetical protein VFO09_00205 [Methyloceanibacter sp.]|nr:hypothetical protein [Methyloceanibacter sp.]